MCGSWISAACHTRQTRPRVESTGPPDRQFCKLQRLRPTFRSMGQNLDLIGCDSGKDRKAVGKQSPKDCVYFGARGSDLNDVGIPAMMLGALQLPPLHASPGPFKGLLQKGYRAPLRARYYKLDFGSLCPKTPRSQRQSCEATLKNQQQLYAAVDLGGWLPSRCQEPCQRLSKQPCHCKTT